MGQATFVTGVHGNRYQSKDVARSVAFYTQHLGFKLVMQQLPAFAGVSLGDSSILLSGPGASGSRPMPNGQLQEPGGCGPGGRQIQVEDPDGNPIELLEPAR
jgi:glyoxylase I family protein